MHEAILCTTIVNAPGLKLQTVEQISDEEIIATTSDGALLHIKPDTNGKHLPWQVVHAIKSFSKKPVSS
eukprot:CAMPEP_0198244406 /NCGR_PEP_ID=MMETSP1446-20131203/34811_1 /TAXON_ID=1461542 ORGANISM="Unidentified sp, Strain CCMP2111" /NCGR_SAMPLE_ID=MMETSP1446 /ASSEMBLY_ACC=CAM_ASM_001112 /LENGTH=68 /DNA_ID=CAMNT_0043928429 /DNA_START=59 /DNA_END=262 /DNA_ORIENTATION=+